MADRREELKAIVARLGPTAEPPAIRQEAYRVGFGVVHGAMLIAARNELWPDRPKHAGGRPKGTKGSAAVFGDRGTGKVHSRRALAMTATHKECRSCSRVLPVDAFSKKTGDPHLFRCYCRECLNKKRAESGFRASLKKHGLTLAEYEAVFAKQNGVCAVCKRPGQGKGNRWQPLVFDHCHETGKFRGLLCDKCNLGLGNFDDRLEYLEAAVAYLRDRSIMEGGAPCQ